jgi:hypothetical protein
MTLLLSAMFNLSLCGRVFQHSVQPSSRVPPVEILADNTPAKLCTVYGFNSKSGSYLYNALFGEAFSSDVVIFRAKLIEELVDVSGQADVAVMHVSQIERNSGFSSLLEGISAHVNGLCKVFKHSSCLVILMDGIHDQNLEEQITNLVAETSLFDKSLEVRYIFT